MKPLEVIGLDLGKVRTGLARGNTNAKLAEPLTTVKTTDIINDLEKLAQKNGLDMLVIGLPRNLEGHDTEQTRWTRQWAKQARTRLKVPMYWQDEALTSQPAKDSVDEHAKAAAIILQDFLDTDRQDRVTV